MGLDSAKIRMVTTDSWIDARRIWESTRIRPPEDRTVFDRDDLEAYINQLGQGTSRWTGR